MNYLEPVEDGPTMNDYGAWTAEKLYYVESYLEVFSVAMHKKPWRQRRFVDLFAGPGKCRDKASGSIYLGSPLLSLTVPKPFSQYIFADQNASNIRALQIRCSEIGNIRMDFFTGDSNILVDGIVEEILEYDREYIKGAWPSLNLAFLDPEGLELRWATVAKLAQVQKMDLIIFYPEGGLNRFMPTAYNSTGTTAVDKFFGGAEWRTIYKASVRAPHRSLIDWYKGKLQALGYTDVRSEEDINGEPLFRNKERNAPLYRLLFASKSELGHDFWRKITKRNLYGQGRLL